MNFTTRQMLPDRLIDAMIIQSFSGINFLRNLCNYKGDFRFSLWNVLFEIFSDFSKRNYCISIQNLPIQFGYIY